MINFKEVFSKLDRSHEQSEELDFYKLHAVEFGIFDYLVQPDDNPRLSGCYIHSWICTDTTVGLKVYFLDGEPVCVSYQLYRKSSEKFFWVSSDAYDKTREYMLELQKYNEDEPEYDLLDEEHWDGIIEHIDKVDHKDFERFFVLDETNS